MEQYFLGASKERTAELREIYEYSDAYSENELTRNVSDFITRYFGGDRDARIARGKSTRWNASDQLQIPDNYFADFSWFTGDKDRLLRISRADDPVLILGSTGTGKTDIGHIIHINSKLHAGKSLCHNLTGTNDKDRMLDDLCGHVKGAYTGAHLRREGLINTAAGGTLQLDEIDKLDLDLQGALLEIVEKRTFRQGGSDEKNNVNCRFLFSCNRDIDELVEKGEFLKDLYYRVQSMRFKIPDFKGIPFEEKYGFFAFVATRECIGRLGAGVSLPTMEAFLKSKKYPGPDPKLFDLWNEYPWGGNYREFINYVKAAITEEDFYRYFHDRKSGPQDLPFKDFTHEQLERRYFENIVGMDTRQGLKITGFKTTRDLNRHMSQFGLAEFPPAGRDE
jgi:transcriptional regulator of aromatic amino acid metabolism